MALYHRRLCLRGTITVTRRLQIGSQRAYQLQWCPAAALQAERLHDGGHFHGALRASPGIQATRLTFFETAGQ